MVDQYDHRYADYSTRLGERGHRVLPPIRDNEKRDPSRLAYPYYWIKESEVEKAVSRYGDVQYFLGYGEATTATTERTLVACIYPCVGVGHKTTLVFSCKDKRLIPALYANLNALVLDYVARQKVSYVTLAQFIFRQLPVLPPEVFQSAELAFIVPRVLELTYNADDMRPFAQQLGYQELPFCWSPERRCVLRAELDAFYAYLYGLTRRELEYILDPKSVMGEDFPSESFRVLKEREIKEFGEYRTQKLVLDAWDRLIADGKIKRHVA
jgi:hypothetical protein